MADTIQFALNAEQTATFRTWQHKVEAETRQPLEGVVFSLTVTRQGVWQILIRPSTEEDLKLQNVPRTDGTYDSLVPHETVLAEYDNFGFASTPLHWRDVGIILHICEGSMLGRGETPRCYVECVNEPRGQLIPFRVSEQPEILEEDVLYAVFPIVPLPSTLHRRIQQYIRTNVTVMLQHWHGEIGSSALLDALQPWEDS